MIEICDIDTRSERQYSPEHSNHSQVRVHMQNDTIKRMNIASTMKKQPSPFATGTMTSRVERNCFRHYASADPNTPSGCPPTRPAD